MKNLVWAVAVWLSCGVPCGLASDGSYEIEEDWVPFGDLTGDRAWSVEEHGRDRFRIEYDEPLLYDPDASFQIQKPTWTIYDCSQSWRC